MPFLVVNQAGHVEDVARDGKVDHLLMVLREAHGGSKKVLRGAVIRIENFTLERERWGQAGH